MKGFVVPFIIRNKSKYVCVCAKVYDDVKNMHF